MGTKTIYRGTTYRGHNKYTQNQIKKHVKDLISIEKKCLEEIVGLNNVENISISRHLHDKSEVSYDFDRLKELLNREDWIDLVVEVNMNFQDLNDKFPDDIRVLIRDDKGVITALKNKRTGKTRMTLCNMCFVYSISKNRVITMYWNKADDHHNSLTGDRYSKMDFYPYLRRELSIKSSRLRYMN